MRLPTRPSDAPRWLSRGREKQARIVATAREFADTGRNQARYVAIDFARLTPDGRQVEVGKDAQYWWRVVLEIDELQEGGRPDTGPRYTEP